MAENRSSNPDTGRGASDEDAPLGLADSRDSSTLPVDDGPAADGAAKDASTEPAGAEVDRRAASAGASGSGSGGGTSTGGFETMLGQVVVQAGVVLPEELERAKGELETASEESGVARTLADVLVERQYATRHQLDRLRQDFEAKRSGRSIPGFKVRKKLGAGAMATVFLAKQISLDRHVAIKVLPKKFSSNPKFIERFYKEGRAAAQLNHPNIVQAYDVGAAGEHHYFVMEYVDGPTVHDRLVQDKRFEEKEAIDVVRQVAKALHHAHERGFIHRDIKPKNVMITKSGRVKLADLGLARAVSDTEAAQAEAGRAYGTPYYISPEQIRGELDIGPQADIYGLGATFYHMVTGKVPFEGKNPSEVMHRHLKAPLEPPDHLNPALSAGCAQVIEMMMAKKRDERYRTVDDLLEDLDLVAQGKPPHFAHRSLDTSSITESLTSVATAPLASPSAPPAAPGRGGAKATESPLFLVLLVGIVLSVLGNLIMLAVVLSG